MKSDTAPKFWKKTRVNNLVRHANGCHYARLCRHGKEIWKSLRTTHASIAEARLDELQKKQRRDRGKEVDRGNAKMSFADAAVIYTQRVHASVTSKRRTKVSDRNQNRGHEKLAGACGQGSQAHSAGSLPQLGNWLREIGRAHV